MKNNVNDEKINILNIKRYKKNKFYCDTNEHDCENNCDHDDKKFCNDECKKKNKN
jgi:hypothetical protein